MGKNRSRTLSGARTAPLLADPSRRKLLFGALALGAGAYGWLGVYQPAQRAAAAKQEETERLAREAAIEKQRLADAVEQQRLDAERKLAEANAATEQARKDAERAEQGRIVGRPARSRGVQETLSPAGGGADQGAGAAGRGARR